MSRYLLLPICFVFIAVTHAFADVERDFDKIRHFRAYDPATDKWSAIEDFKTVEILEDRAQQRPENYIYRSFWAYDPQTSRWYKVDILDHGYRLSAASATPEGSEQEAAPPKKPYRFWKNLGMALRIGGGATFYENIVNNLQLEEKNGKLFLQTEAEAKTEKSHGHLINWFGEVFRTENGFDNSNAKNRKIVRAGNPISFTGQGWNLPATLVMHFTFFERLRLGGGGMFEVNYLKELYPKDAAENEVDTYMAKNQWFCNITWLGLVAFKLIKQPRYGILLDFQVGRHYHTGTKPESLFTENRFVNAGMLYSAGLAYERKLNNYFKFLTRLSGDLKMYQDGPPLFDEDGDDSASVFYRQIAVHLEVGISLNFGKDDDEEDTEPNKSRAGKQGNSADDLGRNIRGAKRKRDRLKGYKNRLKRGIF